MTSRRAALASVVDRTGHPRPLTATTADGRLVRVRSAWWTVAGLRLHARVCIPPDPPSGVPVVLVHGLGVSSRYMVPLMIELADRFAVFAPDLPGYGHSQHPQHPLGLRGLALALLAWMQAADLGAAALIGNSLGCQIAVEAALLAPERVRTLVLQGPTFDPTAHGLADHALRLIRTGLHEPPALNLVIARDYLACGARHPATALVEALRQPLLERAAQIAAPTLVIRGEHDHVVSMEWAQRLTERLSSGEIATVPGGAHALNFSAPGPVALLAGGFIEPADRPGGHATRSAEDSLADFDSASSMLRATARFHHRQDMTGLGAMSPASARLLALTAPITRLLPRGPRELIYSRASGAEAIPPAQAHTVSAERVARWMADQYPPGPYPAVAIGSCSGALVHLCALLGIPFLPQTFLIPIAQPDVGPEEPRKGLVAALPAGRLLLEANPELQLHHMHDPNQDRRTLERSAYFRVKRRRLGPAFESFLRRALPPGATVLVSDCRLRWPVTHVRDRYLFQFGALGGLPAEEFHTGSRRVADHLARVGSSQRSWDPPPPDADAPEAEWGLEPALLDDIHRLANRHDWTVRTIAFDDPEDLSPLVADLYRWWYARCGLRCDRLLIESFILLDPLWSLRTGSVPLWLTFPVDPSAQRAEDYLRAAPAFEEIRLTLFSHGTRGIGVADMERWRSILAHARRHGELLAVDEHAYPRDLATTARFNRALRAIPGRQPAAPALTLAELDEFLHAAGPHPGVQPL